MYHYTCHTNLGPLDTCANFLVITRDAFVDLNYGTYYAAGY